MALYYGDDIHELSFSAIPKAASNGSDADSVDLALKSAREVVSVNHTVAPRWILVPPAIGDDTDTYYYRVMTHTLAVSCIFGTACEKLYEGLNDIGSTFSPSVTFHFGSSNTGTNEVSWAGSMIIQSITFTETAGGVPMMNMQLVSGGSTKMAVTKNPS